MTDEDSSKKSILEMLTDDKVWDDFLEHLVMRVDRPEVTMSTEAFVRERRYRPIIESMIRGDYEFPVPYRFSIPKPGKNEYRLIYTFKGHRNIGEHTVLRAIAWLLNRYNHLFSPNLYSCRDNDGVRGAVIDLITRRGFRDRYCYKADLSNYFNSIDVDILFSRIYSDIDPLDHGSIKLIEKIIRNPNVIASSEADGEDRGKVVVDDSKGVMAGMPFASFLSNYYLSELDWKLYDSGIQYYRFADDMIILADTREELDGYISIVKECIESKSLSMNGKKEFIYGPNEPFVFLGIEFADGRTSISDNNVARSKAKVKSIARKYRRMFDFGRLSRDEAVARTIRAINNHFYGNDKMPYCFCNMYFPMITSVDKLSVIDRYAQDCIRYVYAGKFSKRNYDLFPYDRMRAYGYTPLVSAYRMYRDTVRF